MLSMTCAEIKRSARSAGNVLPARKAASKKTGALLMEVPGSKSQVPSQKKEFLTWDLRLGTWDFPDLELETLLRRVNRYSFHCDRSGFFRVDENLIMLYLDRISATEHSVALAVNRQSFVPDFYFDAISTPEDVLAIRGRIRLCARVAVAARPDNNLMPVNRRFGFIPDERMRVRTALHE
jgi:hypothetical protein